MVPKVFEPLRFCCVCFTVLPLYSARVLSQSMAQMTSSKFQTSKQIAPSKGKVLSAKISAKVDSGRSAPGLGGPVVAPPMSSVIVERHQPVTKVL